MSGATQPEKLPIELMSAIPPAAAGPASSIGGNCQNDATAVAGPSVATTSAAKAMSGWFEKNPIEASPMAHAKHGSAA